MLTLLVFLAVFFVSACSSSPTAVPDDTNLLANRLPLEVSGVTQPQRITDGVVASTQSYWQSNQTSVFGSNDAVVVYDLGELTHIDAVVLQGDANDNYVLSVSNDGTVYRPLWTAKPVRASGMQIRSASNLDASARYVELKAYGGDGKYSVGELALYSNTPSVFPPKMTVRKGVPLHEDVKSRMVLFAAAAVVFLFMNHRDSKLWARLLVLMPLAAGVYLGVRLAEMWPFDRDVLPTLRAGIAAIAAAAVIRYYWPGKGNVPSGRLTSISLAILAVLAIGCYYNFGTPQFRDEAKNRLTLVHPWDMRVYFPVVKYFHELRFDGLYLASLAAYLDNNPNLSESSIGDVRLRDLNNNEMKIARNVMGDIREVRKRFAPERWEMFRKDMKYFQDLMGPGGYLGSLRDHGGNATPIWILSAYPFWAWSDANELTLSLTALLDPLLLIALLALIWRTFGWKASCIVAIVFGTTELSRFGSNLMGSTLRLDWMVAIGFGVCALHRKKWATGGALLAYGGLIRGFPALATLFLCAPVLMWVVDWFRTKKQEKLLPAFRQNMMPFVRAASGAIACVVLLFATSSAVFGYDASWGNWFHKIGIHQDKPNVNHVGLRNVLSYESAHTGDKVLRKELPEPWTDWQTYQLAAFERNKPLFYAGIALFSALAVAACRKRQYHQAALVGMLMIPVYFYPANYYCHYVFLLPLLAATKKDDDNWLFGAVSVVMLLMSVALFPTLSVRQVDVLFTAQSAVILVGYLIVLAAMVYAAWIDLLKRKTDGNAPA